MAEFQNPCRNYFVLMVKSFDIRLSYKLKVVFTFFLGLFACSSAHSQTRELSIPDKSCWEPENKYCYYQTLNLADAIHLPHVELSQDPYNWRLWSEATEIGYALDIKMNVDSAITGSLTLVTAEYVTPPEQPTGRFFFRMIPLKSADAGFVMHLLDSLSINQIPSGSKIRGWSTTFDGTEYCTEFLRSPIYEFKEYSTPSIQAIPEAQHLGSFIHLIEERIDISRDKVEFAKLVPFERYTLGGMMGGIREGISKAQRRTYRKERDRYRQFHFTKVQRDAYKRETERYSRLFRVSNQDQKR